MLLYYFPMSKGKKNMRGEEEKSRLALGTKNSFVQQGSHAITFIFTCIKVISPCWEELLVLCA